MAFPSSTLGLRSTTAKQNSGTPESKRRRSIFTTYPFHPLILLHLIQTRASSSRRISSLAVTAMVQDVAAIGNAESYVYNCVPAFFDVFFYSNKLGIPLPRNCPKIPSFDGCLSEGVMDFMAEHKNYMEINSGYIYNSCRPMEDEFLSILEKGTQKKRKIWAIGPVVSMLSHSPSAETPHKCLQWLDKQEPKSVIYVSFGTTTSLSNDQIKEIAFGLENSKVKFLWVLRDADKANIFDGQIRRAELPEGFEGRVKGVGLVVRDWAPQKEILRHPSTGGFMSHCGWNSCMESITAGVPIAAWPMHSDQPINSTFVTDLLKVGLIVRDWSRWEEIVGQSAIENAVKRLMNPGEEGLRLRNSAEELASRIKEATGPGGASRVEMESFVAHITR